MGCCASSSPDVALSAALRRRGSVRHCHECGENHWIGVNEEFRICVREDVKRNKKVWERFVSSVEIVETVCECIRELDLLPEAVAKELLEYIADDETLLFSRLAQRMEKCMSFGRRTRRRSSFCNLRAKGTRARAPEREGFATPRLWKEEARTEFCVRTIYKVPNVTYEGEASPPYLLYTEGFYIFPGPLGWYKLQTEAFVSAFVYATLEELVLDLEDEEAELIGLSESGSWHPLASAPPALGIPQERLFGRRRIRRPVVIRRYRSPS